MTDHLSSWWPASLLKSSVLVSKPRFNVDKSKSNQLASTSEKSIHPLVSSSYRLDLLSHTAALRYPK